MRKCFLCKGTDPLFLHASAIKQTAIALQGFLIAALGLFTHGGLVAEQARFIGCDFRPNMFLILQQIQGRHQIGF